MLHLAPLFGRICLLFVMGMTLLAVQPVNVMANATVGEEKLLVAPQKTMGKPIMEALSLRRSDRKISDEALTEQDLSNILWAAWGVNRDDERRTVPTARNKQELELFVILNTGIWQYDGIKQTLTLVNSDDLTSKFGSPTTLVYAAPEEPADVSGMHVGSMYQNVGLYCASASLSNVVKTSRRDTLTAELPLPNGYKVFVVQLVGVPK